ncbi:hypothetical protein EAF04_005591 [Stromatinia cepivora]|nr:hypothetical protein EAF04_005591 [Stromatinia cepivora]
MFTNNNMLMSLEELESLMDEQEVAKTMTATTTRNDTSHARKPAVKALTEPDAGQQVSAIPTNTSSADDSQVSGTPEKHLAPRPNLELWKIPVFITENREYHQKYAMETELPWISQLNSSYNLTYFDDASLANHAVRLSFDESSSIGTGFPRVIGMAYALDSAITKPATPEIRPQRQRPDSFVPNTSIRNILASSSHSHPDAGANSSPVTVHPVGGFHEVITISFPTTKAWSSGLQDLNAAKGTRHDDIDISIKGLFGKMQVDVSGPVGRNIRGFVMNICSKRYGVNIKATIK